MDCVLPITKASKDEKGKAYGSDGRLAKGYKQHANINLFLRFKQLCQRYDSRL